MTKLEFIKRFSNFPEVFYVVKRERKYIDVNCDICSGTGKLKNLKTDAEVQCGRCIKGKKVGSKAIEYYEVDEFPFEGCAINDEGEWFLLENPNFYDYNESLGSDVLFLRIEGYYLTEEEAKAKAIELNSNIKVDE